MRYSAAVLALTLMATLNSTIYAATETTPRCKKFCERALSKCKGHDASFDSMDECYEKCPTFPTTQATPYRDIQGGNGLPCREFWLDVVEKMSGDFGFISPGTCDYLAEGGGMCDNSVAHDCGSYCGQLSEEGDCGQGPWNMEESACMKACKGYKNDPKLTDSLRGDSLQCRIYYVNVGEQSRYPGAKKAFCPHAGHKSEMCKAPPADHDSCMDYCDLNAKFCSSKEGIDKCLSYCRGLSPEAKACHLRYVAIAGRCTVPEVPCYHRKVCNEAKEMNGLGFEAAKLIKPAVMPSSDEDSPPEMGEEEEVDEADGGDEPSEWGKDEASPSNEHDEV